VKTQKQNSKRRYNGRLKRKKKPSHKKPTMVDQDDGEEYVNTQKVN